MVDNLQIGVQSADFASRILSGESAGSNESVILSATPPVYDWRQLQKWGVKEARLPPDARVEFREPSVWELHRWEIVAGLVLALSQTLMIAGLLVSRRCIRRAENQAVLMADKSARFINLLAERIDEEIIGAQRRICELLDLLGAISFNTTRREHAWLPGQVKQLEMVGRTFHLREFLRGQQRFFQRHGAP